MRLSLLRGNKLRFTFVADRRNRNATASLIASLEDLPEDEAVAIRVVRPSEALAVDFGDVPAAIDVVCMSSMTADIDSASALLRQMRERSEAGRSPGVRPFISICGGPHPSGDPVSVLRAGFDYCCVGEGEEVVTDIVQRLGTSGGKHATSLADVAGLFSLAQDSTGNARAGTTLGSLPEREAAQDPRAHLIGTLRDTYVNLDRYPPLPRRFRFRGYIEVGRGCRWSCSYCQNPRMFGPRERFRSPAMVEETVARYAAAGMKDIRLLLPNALGYACGQPGKPNCEALEELLRRTRLAAGDGNVYFGFFPSEIRPDYVTPEAIAILRQYVANRKVVIGGQSGSPRVLELVGRGHTVEDIVRACRIISCCGLAPVVDLMLGLPFEESEDRGATFAIMDTLRPAGVTFNLHFFMPLPGTPLANTTPRFLSEDERRHIDGLAQQGLVIGRWRSQEDLSRRWLNAHAGSAPSS